MKPWQALLVVWFVVAVMMVVNHFNRRGK